MQTQDQKELISFEEAVKRGPFSLSWLYRKAAERDLPGCHRLGGRLWLDWNEFLRATAATARGEERRP